MLSAGRDAYDASVRIDFRAHLTEKGRNYGLGKFIVSETRDFVRVTRKLCIAFFWKNPLERRSPIELRKLTTNGSRETNGAGL